MANAHGDIAVIGLAVMGQNLILNMNDKGFTVVVYNRTVSKVDAFLQGAAKGRKTIIGARSIEEMVSLLAKPRKVMLMVKAGKAVDDIIDQLLPLLEEGDVLIDGGNSYFADTIRRTKYLSVKDILFVGTGISGGEEGARNGPAIMPGGTPEAWPLVKELFQAIAAKTPDRTPCCDWVGNDGAGHYVKMTHNGIEYGDMQLIAEAYHFMRDGLRMSHKEMSAVFASWNNGDLSSYLIEITADILKHKDDDGTPLVEKIMDSAGQKGTGRWTSESALELGIPVTLISEAVSARSLSSLKNERMNAAKVLNGPKTQSIKNKKSLVKDIAQALLASKIISYAQGFMLMREAAREYGWLLDFASIALIWRNGCIIRSVFLDKIAKAFRNKRELDTLLLDDYFRKKIDKCQPAWRRIVGAAAQLGIPIPALSAALSFYDGYRCAHLPANLLQAQRDYFGAHTYERVDKPKGQFYHTDWTGKGGSVSASTYTV
jgi:6-phosphogluconate dehydrogenase